jgi:hypothetical protein
LAEAAQVVDAGEALDPADEVGGGRGGAGEVVAVEAGDRALEVDDLGLPVVDLEEVGVVGLLADELDGGGVEEVVEDELQAAVDHERGDAAPFVGAAAGGDRLDAEITGADRLDEVLALEHGTGAGVADALGAEQAHELAGVVGAGDALENEVVGVADAAIGVVHARALREEGEQGERGGQAQGRARDDRGAGREERRAGVPWHGTSGSIVSGRGRAARERDRTSAGCGDGTRSDPGVAAVGCPLGQPAARWGLPAGAGAATLVG